jgi:predicted TIM-barrel fold metal-dependent hydrolase
MRICQHYGSTSRPSETGLYEDGKKGVRRPGDPDQRIKDMDRDGVDAEIIFGILGVASRVRDHEAANEMLRIYNDWLKGFCSHYPDRQIGLACLPYRDIDAAVNEVYRVTKLGLRGLELSCSWDMEPMCIRCGSRCGKPSMTCNYHCISTPCRRACARA